MLNPATSCECKRHDPPCPVDIAWVRLSPSGRPLLIEIEALDIEPKPRLVLVNHSSGGAMVITQKLIDEGYVAAWQAKHDMTLHRAHFASSKCPVAKARKAARKKAAKPQQELSHGT